LIIRPPDGMAGRVEHGIVEHIDVPATFRAIAGAAPIPGSAGNDLSRHFPPGGSGSTREVAISENHGFAAFITDRYKLIVWEDTREPVALFDLTEDPDEDANLIGHPDAASIRQQMMERYVAPFLATPPVRKGPHMVDRPVPARTNHRPATERNPASTPGDGG
jgi:arylsulfatase A-like enzyme